MTSASPNSSVETTVSTTIEAEVVYEDGRAPQQAASSPPPNSSSSALSVGSGNFNAFLAPLNRQDFKQVVEGVQGKLEVVNQTLGMLDSLLDSQGFDAILDEMLQSITSKTGELLHVDRATIFLLDEEKNELFTIVAKDEKGNAIEIRFPATVGIAGEVATEKKPICIPYDFYDDPRSETAKKIDKKNKYRTYTMLAMPLINEETQALVAVVQLINKLKPDAAHHQDLADRVDPAGFSPDDEEVFREFGPSIRLILESSKAFYAATQKQRAASALMGAVNSLSKSSLDLEDTLKRVMDEAKDLMNADRSTLWLLDEERGELWTKIPINGKSTEIRIPRNAGFAGMVAESGEPLLLPFDIYKDDRSKTSKETDKKTGYRTCSMLCMPVFNADDQLIGVTQLINKIRQGDHPPYDSSMWPDAPEIWRASFNRSDLEFMKAFNTQAGVALQNAKLFATVKQQEQRQKDILRSLTNGVISTDKSGNIIAVNESATILLGITEEEAAALEGQPLAPRITLKEGQFETWFNAALKPKEERDRQQYYPNQVLVYEEEGREDQSINLSINTMADAIDPEQVNGALVVMEDISDEMEVKNLMYKYMTPEVAEALLDSGDTGLGGQRKQVSVLFSDIRSYTTLTEKLEPEEVVLMLNEYFEEMVDAVFTYGGTLDKYIGDALMAVFGFPAPLEDHQWSSIQSAVAMRQRLAIFNEHRKEQGKMPISIGMGIHSDEVLSGNIGSSKRMELTSIGDGVNLASRLEGTSKQYGTDLIISGATYEPHADKLAVRELDFITVKGKTQPVTIYELIAITEGELARSVTPDEQEVIDRYAAGRHHYLQPAREKLSTEELVEALHQLAGLSDAEVSQLSYEPKKLLEDILATWSREALIDVIGEDALLRMLNATSWSEITDAEFRRTLPFKVKQLTPRLIKRMVIAKLRRFTGDETAQQMLVEEANEMTVPQIEKLIDILRPVLIAKSKQSFRLAREEFKAVIAVKPKDKAAKLHVERCMLFEQQPPNEDWEGVWKLESK